jgi:shikimate kinase
VIINIIGTSGSGKSTLARKVMDMYCQRVPISDEGRKQPLGYTCTMHDEMGEQVGRPLVVLGHYETACGGCDTIPTGQFDRVYQLVRQYHEAGNDVLFEGLLLSAEHNRRAALHNDFPGEVVLVHLTTDFETCIQSIKQRRAAKRGVPVEEQEEKESLRKNALSKYKGSQAIAAKFEAVGGTVFHCDREQAEAVILETLEL